MGSSLNLTHVTRVIYQDEAHQVVLGVKINNYSKYKLSKLYTSENKVCSYTKQVPLMLSTLEARFSRIIGAVNNKIKYPLIRSFPLYRCLLNRNSVTQMYPKQFHLQILANDSIAPGSVGFLLSDNSDGTWNYGLCGTATWRLDDSAGNPVTSAHLSSRRLVVTYKVPYR